MAGVTPKDKNPFSCPICLDSLEDPVTIPCGHNCCMACIEDYWNEDKHSETYSCPKCRETFTQRPLLNKNTMFAEVVEQFKKTRLRDPSPRNPGPANTGCGVCTGRKRQVVQLCPGCVESNCKAQHEKANSGDKNIVIVINREPRMDICLRHNLPLDIYCRTDRQLICTLCFAQSHKDHDAVSVAPGSTERQERTSSHVEVQQAIRQTSHKHNGKTHNRSGHGNGRERRRGSRSRKTLRLKSGREASHHESHGNNVIRHAHGDGGAHVKSKHTSRHGAWHMSSGRERSQH